MQARFTTAVLLGSVLIAVAACGGGSDTAKLTELEERVEAAEEARKEAERKAEEDKAAREKAAADKAAADKAAADAAAERLRQAEAARDKAVADAAKAREEAERRIEEAQRQADVAQRVTPLITTTLSTSTGFTDAGAQMGVAWERGERRTFTRPLNLPAKGSAPSVPGGWSSASYSGPKGNVGTDTVYLYTNIQAPGSKAFWKEHGESVTGLTGAASGFTDAPTVTVSGFGTTAKELYPATDGTLDGASTTSDTRARSIGGTYGGYSGTFKCDASCDIAAAEGGALTFEGTWTFTASLTAKRSSKYAEQDTEFLYFGIWASDPTDPAGTHEFKWARGGASVISDANFTALTGTAEFRGGAIGKYALAKVGGRDAKIGTFTATANFTADFGAADAAGTLSGRITDFKEGGTSLGSDWHVFLGSSASAAATLVAAAGGMSASDVADAGAIDGDTATVSWAATLHGSDNEDMSSADDYTAAKYPRADVAGIAGWFRAAAGTNAAIAGAFGAACTTGAMCAK